MDDFFKGNKKLESVIFDGLDLALFKRHNSKRFIHPFMLLYRDGEREIVHFKKGDPNKGFYELLQKTKVTYDQIVMCFEGRVPEGNKKLNAIIVKGFDTSEAHGLMFVQRFEGIEKKGIFKKIGVASLVSVTEPLPITPVKRSTNKTIENPYMTGVVIEDDDGWSYREIIVGHENASVLSTFIYQGIVSTLAEVEDKFSGKFNLIIVPDTLEDSDLNRFILNQLIEYIKQNKSVQEWERKHGRNIEISYVFNSGRVKTLEKENRSESTNTISKKPWWKIW